MGNFCSLKGRAFFILYESSDGLWLSLLDAGLTYPLEVNICLRDISLITMRGGMDYHFRQNLSKFNSMIPLPHFTDLEFGDPPQKRVVKFGDPPTITVVPPPARS